MENTQDIEDIDPTIKVRTDRDRTFNVRIVPHDGYYGKNWGVRNKYDRALVEFYDATYEANKAHGSHGLGQFVSRYFVEDVMHNAATGRGLDLDGGVECWVIDGRTMLTIGDWVHDEVYR